MSVLSSCTGVPKLFGLLAHVSIQSNSVGYHMLHGDFWVKTTSKMVSYGSESCCFGRLLIGRIRVAFCLCGVCVLTLLFRDQSLCQLYRLLGSCGKALGKLVTL